MKSLVIVLALVIPCSAQNIRAFVPMHWTVEGKEVPIQHTELLEGHKGDLLLALVNCPNHSECAQVEYVLGSLANPRFELSELKVLYDAENKEHILFGGFLAYDSKVAFYIPTLDEGDFSAGILILGGGTD